MMFTSRGPYVQQSLFGPLWCDTSHGSWLESMRGHRCKAKAKRLHPVTIGSLSSHGSSGSWLPAKSTGRCLVCGVSKSPDEPFQPGADCCSKDWEVYLAFTHLGTFDDFVQIKSNDEWIAKQIQQARQLLSKRHLRHGLPPRWERRTRSK